MHRFDSRYDYDYHFMVPKLMCTEVWPVRDLVRKEWQVIFDVGASHGAWTKAWLDSFGPAVETMHLFEPLPGSAEEIRDKLRAGFFDESTPGAAGQICLNQIALGDRKEKMTLHYDRPTSGLASLAQSSCVLPDRVVEMENQTRVSVSTLDDYCRDRAVDFIDLIKIDTEGYELNVLRGGEPLFRERAVGAVLFEFGSHQVPQGHSFRDFHEFFTGLGYEMFQLGLGRLGWKRIPISRYQAQYEDRSNTWMFGAFIPGGVNP